MKALFAFPVRRALSVLLASAMFLGFSHGHAQNAFQQGSKRVSVIVGAGSSFDEDYLILGAGIGYYLIDGLEIGLNWQTWLGGDPSINQLTPEITYVVQTKSGFSPYIGALYRKTFIEDLDDLSAYGGRAGVYLPAGEGYYLGVGAVYLKYSGCSESVYQDCSTIYPEFSFSIPF